MTRRNCDDSISPRVVKAKVPPPSGGSNVTPSRDILWQIVEPLVQEIESLKCRIQDLEDSVRKE